jgi:hypothetical protein
MAAKIFEWRSPCTAHDKIPHGRIPLEKSYGLLTSGSPPVFMHYVINRIITY